MTQSLFAGSLCTLTRTSVYVDWESSKGRGTPVHHAPTDILTEFAKRKESGCLFAGELRALRYRYHFRFVGTWLTEKRVNQIRALFFAPTNRIVFPTPGIKIAGSTWDAGKLSFLKNIPGAAVEYILWLLFVSK